MKKPWRKWCLLGIAVVIAVIGIPIIINESYKVNSGYTTLWEAKDVLSYYGSVLGAFMSAITIIITIRFTRRQIQRESYFKAETEKWTAIEMSFADALNTINPTNPLMETMDTGLINPQSAIITFQKYEMSCQMVAGSLVISLNFADCQKVKPLVESINQCIQDICKICEDEISAYSKIRDISHLKTAEETLKMENY